MLTAHRLVVGCATALILAVGSAGAFANRIRLDAYGGDITRIRAGSGIIWGEGQSSVSFSGANDEFVIPCALLFTISFNRTLSKSWNEVVGSLTAIEVGECRSGVVRVLSETLPWDITYDSFTGSLPYIQSLRLDIEDFAWLAEVWGIWNCLYRLTQRFMTYENPIDELELDPLPSQFIYDVSLNRYQEIFPCPSYGEIEGWMRVSPNVTMTLI